jgi:hypothetical protein
VGSGSALHLKQVLFNRVVQLIWSLGPSALGGWIRSHTFGRDPQRHFDEVAPVRFEAVVAFRGWVVIQRLIIQAFDGLMDDLGEWALSFLNVIDEVYEGFWDPSAPVVSATESPQQFHCQSIERDASRIRIEVAPAATAAFDHPEIGHGMGPAARVARLRAKLRPVKATIQPQVRLIARATR